MALLPGRPYTLRLTLGSKAESGLAMPLVVEDGIDDRTADFEIALDSNDSELRRPARVVVLETREEGRRLTSP